MKWLLFLPLICGCGILISDKVNIEIGENDFRTASSDHPEKIEKFTDNPVTYNELDSLILYEINAKQIKQLSAQNAYTWVHIWLPYCPNDLCQNIDFFQRLADSAKTVGLTFLMVSATYELAQIDTIAKHAQFRYPIYVMENESYGQRLKPARKKFAAEMGAKSDQIFVDDYFYKNDSLLFLGEIKSQAMLDSLMRLPG